MTTKSKKTATAKTKFDFREIKTFEDACKKVGVDPTSIPDVSLVLEEFRSALIAAYKLMIIYKAINNGWKPDWNNYNQWKYYPWFGVSSSGFGFSYSDFDCDNTITAVSSRLCTDTSEKSEYIAKQFEEEYKEYFLYK